MKIGYRGSDGKDKYILLGKDKRNAERLARGEMFACPRCGEPLEFGVDRCRHCQTFLDPANGQVRTDISDQELNTNIENKRKTYRIANTLMFSGIAVAAFGPGLTGGNGFVMLAGIAMALGGFLVKEGAKSAVKGQVSQTVIPEILAGFFEQVKYYDANGHISDEAVRRADIFSYNRMYGSDHVGASYRGVDIEMSDLKLEQVTTRTVTDDNGNSKEEEDVDTVFHGQWIIFDFHKELTADLSVYGGSSRRSGSVETENAEFNRKYRIYCSSAHDAFYVLTPHMMEHIMSLEGRAGGTIFLVFLKEGKVHLAVYSHRDHFEVGSLDAVDIDELRKKFRDEMSYVTGLVDELLTVDTLYSRSGTV